MGGAAVTSRADELTRFSKLWHTAGSTDVAPVSILEPGAVVIADSQLRAQGSIRVPAYAASIT